MKTFTTSEAIDFTYDYGTSTSAKDLNEFLLEAGSKRAVKGFNSAWVHRSSNPDYELEVVLEAYDDDFLELTRTEHSTELFRERVDRHVTKLFPNTKIQMIWYSGYNGHWYYTIG